MSDDRSDGSGVFSIMGTVSKISNSIAELGKLDSGLSAINTVSKFSKVSIFGALSLMTSNNRTATAIGLAAGVVGGVVVGAAIAVPLSGLIGGFVVGVAVEYAVRRLGIGESSQDEDDSSVPPSSIPDAALPNVSPWDPGDPPEGPPSTPISSIPDAALPNVSPWVPGSPPEAPPATPISSIPDAPRPDMSPWSPGNPSDDGGGGGGGNDGGFGKPVVLDLDGDGVELIELEDSAAFYDIHGTGFDHHMSWVGADDGILAYDANGDGVIDERGEISFVEYLAGARTDLEGLRHFDSNGDGVFDSSDAEWHKFRVWQDLDQDGVSDPGELRTLDEVGIQSISLESTGGTETRGDGTRIFGHGTYVVDDGGVPVTRELLDVALRVSPWGFRETEDGVAIRWTDGEEAVAAFLATSDAPLTLDLAGSGYRGAVGGGGADRLSSSGSDTVMLAGMDGDDVLRGGSGSDLILGGAGDDELHGGAGTDIVDGGGGADRVEAGDGEDLVHGGAGSDTLDGGADRDAVSYETSDAGVTVDLRDADGDGDHDTASGGHADGDRIRNFEDVVGSAYDDTLTGDDGANWLEGGEGRDVLHGGAGDDVLAAGINEGGGWQELYGEAGNDTYLIGMADGMVRIGSAAESAATGDADTVEFTDLSLADVEFTFHDYTEGGTVNSPEGTALVVRWTKDGTSGELHVADMGREIERFVFADGSTLGRVEADWLARLLPQRFGDRTDDRLVGTSGDDVMTSGSGDEDLSGGAGDDRLNGAGGSDQLDGEEGDDTLLGGEGNDGLKGRDGSDVLDGGAGDDRLFGGDGDDELSGGAGRDVLYGDGGDDDLSAGGNETGGAQELYGGAGNDTYRYSSADGIVHIGSGAEGADTGEADRVVFTDLSLDEVEFSINRYTTVDYAEDGTFELVRHEALVVNWSRAGESGRLWMADGGRHIERFEFADGSTLGRVDVDASALDPVRYARHAEDRLVGTDGADVIRRGAGHDWVEGGAGDDELHGGTGHDWMDGGAGDDELHGGTGRDWMDGGAGDDELHGGTGRDTYEFAGRAFGRDRVVDTGGRDTIEFSDGATWDQLWFSRSGDDLEIALLGTQSGVTVEDWWNGPLVSDIARRRQVETLVAGDHTLSSGAVTQLVEAMAGMSPPPSGQTELTALQHQQMAAPLAAWQELPGS